MTTPLLRETIHLITEADIDPTEFQWFDISKMPSDNLVENHWLKNYRPPFEKCIVVHRGKSKNHPSYDLMMMIVGDDPEEGVVVNMWKGPTGKMPRALPSMVYIVEDDTVKYGPTQAETNMSQEEASVILGVVAAWFQTMAEGSQCHQPSIRKTFTNLRKIKQGKAPTYDWTTVTIGPKAARSEHQGGTHASPRLHDRRGHLRRLRSGKNVWVKSCKVGKVELGTVFHDYEVAHA